METRRPIETAIYSNNIDHFVKKLAKLGFAYEGIGKPEMLTIAGRSTTSFEELRQFDTVQEFLIAKDADGGLVLNMQHSKNEHLFDYLLVTILPYRLIKLSEPR